MKKGLILLNAYYRTPSIDSQVARLTEEFGKLGVEIIVRANSDYGCIIENNDIKRIATGYDFCVYLDKDKYISAMLERCGMRLFNNSRAIECCDDKMTTYIKLAGKGIKIPKTLPGLLCYLPKAVITDNEIEKVEAELSYPIIVKECYGSRGVGTYAAYNRIELSNALNTVKLKPHLIQEFTRTSYGRDVRVMVVGGEVLGAMIRTSKNDFRSNIDLGGVGAPYELRNEDAQIAATVAKELKLDYCGIDFLFDENGNPNILCEVNSNAFFAGFEKYTKINVAERYAKYIYKEMYGK